MAADGCPVRLEGPATEETEVSGTLSRLACHGPSHHPRIPAALSVKTPARIHGHTRFRSGPPRTGTWMVSNPGEVPRCRSCSDFRNASRM